MVNSNQNNSNYNSSTSHGNRFINPNNNNNGNTQNINNYATNSNFSTVRGNLKTGADDEEYENNNNPKAIDFINGTEEETCDETETQKCQRLLMATIQSEQVKVLELQESLRN